MPRFPKMPKFRVIEGKPDTSPAGQVRRRTRATARDWPHCPHCGGREVIQAKTGNVKSDLCVACLLSGKRVVVE